MTGVGGLVRDYVRAQADRLGDVLGDADSPAAVHRTRVSARRIRSVLAAFGPWTPDAGDLRHELRWVGSVMGPLRTLDVLGRLFSEDAELLEEIGRRRASEAVAARERLAGSRATRLTASLEDLLSSDGWSDQPADLVTRRVLSRELERVLERADVAHPPGPDRDERLHDVRKAAKRLRYAAEASAPALPVASAVAARAEGVQEVLGAHNDRTMARAWLVELARDRPDLARRATLPAAADPTAYDTALAALLT